MAIIRYLYLLMGWMMYGLMNVISYTSSSFEGPIQTKIIFSTISLILLLMDNIIILKSEWIFKRPFHTLTKYHQFMVYLGVLVIPLISLYYQA